MGINKIDSADTSDYSSQAYDSSAAANRGGFQDFHDVANVDDTTELTYMNMNWDRCYAQYRTIAEVGNMIDRKALWVAGAGWESPQKEMLDKIRGNGKDTFESIMVNLTKVYTIGGDGFAEIIRKRKLKDLLRRTGEVVNLKPINPKTVKIIANKFGIIKEYQLYKDQNQTGKPYHTIKPEKMFHLMWNRTADQIHGQSTLEKLQRTINGIEEAKKDQKVLFHRYVKPLTIISVDTDDTTEIAGFKTKWNSAYQKSEIMIVPAETVKDIKTISVPQYSTLDPLPYLRRLEEDFTKAEGVADVILGVASKEMTEASGKIIYLAWEAVVNSNQRFLKDQLMAQCGIDATPNKPISLEPDVKADTKKDVPIALNKPKQGKDD